MTRFNEDNPADMLALELIVEMYQAVEAPFILFSSDGVTTLRVPPTIKKLFPIPTRARAYESKEIPSQEIRGVTGVSNA